MLIEEDQVDVAANCGAYTRTRSIVTGRWRMTLWLEQAFGELYDCQNDPDEIVNLWNNAGARAEKANLTALMLDERLKLDDVSLKPKFIA